jgi:hypothetical protein
MPGQSETVSVPSMTTSTSSHDLQHLYRVVPLSDKYHIGPLANGAGQQTHQHFGHISDHNPDNRHFTSHFTARII